LSNPGQEWRKMRIFITSQSPTGVVEPPCLLDLTIQQEPLGSYS